MVSNHLAISSLLLLAMAFTSFLFVQPHLSSGRANPLKTCNFDKIYQLGDSLSDTGNLIRESQTGTSSAFSSLPYGETYFENATGRCSNGLLMIDYIAMAADLPFLVPYKDNDGDFSHGVNFAVAGSTALPADNLAGKNIATMLTKSSLGVQLDWMSTHFSSMCTRERDCIEKLKNSLFMVGEIGGNDYNYALLEGKTMDEVKNIVADVVRAISNAVGRVIDYGAVRVVVPGNIPIGCLPLYLTAFQSNASAAYDEDNCLTKLNDLATYHNNQLKEAIRELKKYYPNTVIVYGDYYRAFQRLFRNAESLGFDGASSQKACCGTGGDYNFNLTDMCGAPGVPVCRNPNEHISWDGVHLTQEAYKIMSEWLLSDIVPKLHCPI
ncbi:hypothetical protein RHGRI_021451 [Rhododendron griersonianum]|uniref:Uncharacterized protein n=1 Tax=Rhododendron griersonianum TaxID=479676 RepID=A0AAV6JP74_9ERIC|nr:hypothetical protein RHGRI_021451 [Rhododendron griersonianum]